MCVGENRYERGSVCVCVERIARQSDNVCLYHVCMVYHHSVVLRNSMLPMTTLADSTWDKSSVR